MSNRETVTAARECTKFTFFLFIETFFVCFVEYVGFIGDSLNRLQVKRLKEEKIDFYSYAMCNVQTICRCVRIPELINNKLNDVSQLEIHSIHVCNMISSVDATIYKLC